MEDVHNFSDAIALIDAYKREIQNLEMTILQLRSEAKSAEGAMAHVQDKADEWRTKAEYFKELCNELSECDKGLGQL